MDPGSLEEGRGVHHFPTRLRAYFAASAAVLNDHIICLRVACVYGLLSCQDHLVRRSSGSPTQAAQQLRRLTSLLNAWAASFSPST